MANPVADPKSAVLSDELKEYAVALPPTVFPKNFFCAICTELAIDSWKLLCCNKSICSSCHAKLEFPTTCPLCEHTPLEADTCTVNKSLRNTMRAWLQKKKKKEEETKNTAQVTTPPAATLPGAADAQPTVESRDKPMESVEDVSTSEDAIKKEPTNAGENDGAASLPTGSAVSQSKETSTAPQNEETQRRASLASQNPTNSVEPTSATEGPNAAQNTMDGSADNMYGNNPMFNNMNGMSGQFGFGVDPNQGSFNGMGWNGMNPMSGMPNMMGNGNFNMNPMDYNNMNPNMANGMYGSFGGNMGMPGMNDMSMMNYGGGYGNGWQGGMTGAGYGNFNGYNPMGGYNQSGAQYPQMMNQFPKNNFQNQNRFQANGAPFQQNNRRGSYGNFGNQNGPGFQSAQSRPGSRSGPSHNVRRISKEPSLPPTRVPHPLPRTPNTDVSAPPQRDGQSPAGDADAAPETKVKNEHAEASAEPAEQGKVEVAGTSESVASGAAQADDGIQVPTELTRPADDEANSAPQTSGLNPIQTVDSIEEDTSTFDLPLMNNAMHSNQPYPQGMMGDFGGQGAHMNVPYGVGMGYNQNTYGPSGGFSGAYGAATVLTGEPKGVGVEGAPTGPRAMREGRPNTGFSSRANNVRFNSHAPSSSVPPPQDAPAASPPRRGRQSPQRDDTLRTKERSPSRSHSRSGSRARDDEKEDYRERSRSADRESRRKFHDRSATPTSEDDRERRKERRRHRSSRYDDRDDRDAREEDYEARHRDDRDDRGDRTRSASVESKHRSRRDKDKHRSSRSHRDRSREHRRRHRSRSRSPVAEDKYEDDEAHANGADLPSESSSRRKNRSDKDKHRERDRDRSRDRDRDRDRRDRRERDHEREYEKEKDRIRDKDKDRKRSRRDREDEEDERDYDDEKHRSSRRSRKERDRERDKDRDYQHRDAEREPTSARAVSPPLNAPTGPSADNFSIRGFSKTKRADISTTAPKPMAPPPTGPRALQPIQPPKGPAADRDRERRDSRDHRRKGSISGSMPTTPTTPSSQDQNHYAADRERHTKERVDRDNRDKVISSIHGRATSRSNSISQSDPAPASKSQSQRPLASKRSREDVEDVANEEGKETKIPTGPAAHRDKRRKSGDNAIANLFTAGLRKQAQGSKRERRGGVKTEGDAEKEMERVERERERRW